LLDTVGVGFGPGNIALAVAYAESGNPRTIHFVEANAGPGWQDGMLIPGSDIQHNPLRDFITPRNPCSPYGFLSYLKSQGRLFHFLNLDAPFPPRSDYARYTAWVAEQFAHLVSYSERVEALTLVPASNAAGGLAVRVDTASRTLEARSLCFAPGRSRNIPGAFVPLLGENVIHFTDYKSALGRWRRAPPRSIAVIGSSQSAVEVLLDLHQKIPESRLHSIFRKLSFVLKDTSPFTEDLVFPEFTDYFFSASPESKRSLTSQVLRSNYGSVDHDVLKKLYFTLYEERACGVSSIMVHSNTEVLEASRGVGGIRMALRDVHAGARQTLCVDAVVLATGFRNFGTGENEELIHPLLEKIAGFYRRNDDGTLQVTRSYQLVPSDEGAGCPPIFLNGLCESSHGLGDAGSFSLLSYRAFDIEQALAEVLDRGVVPVRRVGGA
jgi:L-ornithine N5-oxygenase